MPEIQAAIKGGVDKIKDIIAWVKQWYADNKEDIDSIRKTFSEFFSALEGFVRAFISLFKILWAGWGDDTNEITNEKFAYVKASFEFWMDSITGTMKAATALMQGDWVTFLDLINENTVTGLKNGQKLFQTYFDYMEDKQTLPFSITPVAPTALEVLANFEKKSVAFSFL